MSLRIQTTVESVQPIIVLVGRASAFITQLRLAIEAMHLTVRMIDPSNLLTANSVEDVQRELRGAYLCIWIDTPTFRSQEDRQRENTRIVSALKKGVPCPLRFITFDAVYDRKNGSEGRVPTHSSRELLQLVLNTFPSASTTSYYHVFIPFDDGLSVVQRFISEKILQGNTHPMIGSCAPLWYEDVIDHITAGLYDLENSSGLFAGHTVIDFAVLESSLRSQARFPPTEGKSQVFPFAFPQAVAIGKTSWQDMAPEIALTLPQPGPVEQSEKAIHRPVFPQQKNAIRSKRIRSRKRHILRVVGALVVGVVATYIGIAIVFLIILVGMRERLSVLASKSPTHMWTQGEVEGIEQRALLLQRLAKTVPLPYSLIGLQLPREGVIEGLGRVVRLSATVSRYHQAIDLLVKRMSLGSDMARDDSALEDVNSHLEAGYKELSEIQSDISKGNLILDSLFGVDGLSGQIVVSLGAIREEITQYKAATSLVTVLLPTTQKSTLLIVSSNPAIARPLFGTPIEVGIIEIDQGRVMSTNIHSVEKLDEMLRGKVELPADFHQFSQSDEWNLSSGAWSVDGPTAARQIAWFISKQLHIEADNIVFIDDSLIAQIHSQMNSKPQTAPILGTTTQSGELSSLLELFASGEPSVVKKGIETLGESLNSSQATLFSRDITAAKTLKALAWDGGVRTPNCPTPFVVDRDCQVSTRYVVEYDFPEGDQYASVMSKDNQVHQISITDAAITHTDLIVYPKASAPGVKKLLKYLIDREAVISSVTVNGEARPIQDIIIGQEFEKTSISIPIELSSQSINSISLVYSTPPLKKSNSSLVFFVQKQVGMPADPFTLELKHQKGYTLSLVSPRGAIDRAGVSFTTTLQTNKVFALGFE